MTRDEWNKFVDIRIEEASLLPHRSTVIVFELIRKLGEIIFDLYKRDVAPPLVGPCSPREARDEIEGEAVAPTDPEDAYCSVSWKDHSGLCCTRPLHMRHRDGDHVVGKGGMIVARWPAERCKAVHRAAPIPLEKLKAGDDSGMQCILNEHDGKVSHRFK